MKKKTLEEMLANFLEDSGNEHLLEDTKARVNPGQVSHVTERKLEAGSQKLGRGGRGGRGATSASGGARAVGRGAVHGGGGGARESDVNARSCPSWAPVREEPGKSSRHAWA